MVIKFRVFRTVRGTIWNLEKSFEIGEVGDTDFYIWFMGLGQYRARQWEISCASNTPLIVSGVVEEFDLGVT